MSERLEELRRTKAEREKARAEAAEAAELEALELEDKFEAELGPRGQAFELVDATDLGEGILVVKLGEPVLFRKFQAAVQSKAGAQASDVQSFVIPQIAHPEREKAKAIFGRRGVLLVRCQDAALALHGVKGESSRGKF